MTSAQPTAKIAFFGTRNYDREFFDRANQRFGHGIVYLEPRLTAETAPLAQGCRVACSFVNDRVDAEALRTLSRAGIDLLALRCAGFNHVDLVTAEALGIGVVRVPEYSPDSVAEHAVALVLTLCRKIHRAHARVREGNFSLDGLVGIELHGKTVGVVGTGRIGRAAARIFRGFGCRVLAADPKPDPTLAAEGGIHYVDAEEIYRNANVISLHLPLTPTTRHLISAPELALMRPDVILINTSRGALIDSPALIAALKQGRIGGAALDVYEEEEGIFFEDLSNDVLQDDTLARLLTFPNVLVTSHQAFLTREALTNIADTTLENVAIFAAGQPLQNTVLSHEVLRPTPPRAE